MGELKFNCDASNLERHTFVGIVLRNNYGETVGAWTHHFYAPNTFCVELGVVLQTFTLVETMNLHKVTFEGDCLSTIMVLKG